MKNSKKVLLPGLSEQINFLLTNINVKEKKVLVIGAASVQPATLLNSKTGKTVDIIVEDYDSLITSKLSLPETRNVKIKLMDFERTDYADETFDLIFAQGSISDFRRNKIIKEIKRILKPDGYLSVGEVTKLQTNLPRFVQEIFDWSDINPLLNTEVGKYYNQKNFEIIYEKDLSFTLKKYYELTLQKLKTERAKLTDNEKIYYKKLLKKITHESNAYIKHGANKFIGFQTLLLRKKQAT